jgi:hypothetical protein
MSGCNRYKPSSTCGTITEATCVRIEDIDFPEISELHGEECASLDVVIEDIYNIIENLDLSNYDNKCLEGTPETLVEVLQAQTDKICEIAEGIQGVCDILDADITECGIDTSCLEEQDPCQPATPITTLKQLLIKLIEKSCQTPE